MTLHVSISHNLAVPSSHPLTTFFPFRDNALLYTLPSPSLQSSPNCFPLFEFHTRSEPPNEQVMICCPPGRLSEVIQVRCYLSFHRSNFKIITYEEVSIAMSRQQGKVIFSIKSELNAQLPDALFGLLKLDAAAVENMDMVGGWSVLRMCLEESEICVYRKTTFLLNTLLPTFPSPRPSPTKHQPPHLSNRTSNPRNVPCFDVL
ncbi:hypothetical protein C8R48DRAFT_774911 [Suillus tomentosus]|nr:hypothetical protein C8R48DRAFT_774911 [Suillus tomentosus]